MMASLIEKFAKSAQQNKCQVSRTAYITAQPRYADIGAHFLIAPTQR